MPSHRLRRHLHLRHDRLGDRAGAARPETDRRRSAGRVRRVRAADGRRAWGSRPACFPPTAPSRCAPTASTRRSPVTGRPVRELFPDLRIFVERVRRGDQLIEADADTVLERRGRRRHLRTARGADRARRCGASARSDDRELLNVPVDGGRRLRHEQGRQRQDAARARRSALHARRLPAARSRGTWWRSRSCRRPKILRGDILTLVGSTRHIDAAVDALGYADRPARGDRSDDRRRRALRSARLVGALSVNWGGVPISAVDVGRRAARRPAARLLARRSVRRSAGFRRPRCGS